MKNIIAEFKELPEWSKPIIGLLALIIAAILLPVLLPLGLGYLFFITIFE